VAEGVRLVVGSHLGCDIVVQDRTVSSQHCELVCKKGVLWVLDLGSKNGLYAGGARVKRAQLNLGSYFAVGRVPFFVRTDQGPVEDDEPLPGVVGTSSAMMRVASDVRRLARLSVPVLIRGATGTGKEKVAHAIHALSRRSEGPFCPLNVGAVPPSLAAAELFGHDRGAFTDAGHVRRGAFLSAHGGTLFLDEIGEVNADVQVLLLRALEQREVQPLGSDRRVSVDVRVVAATWAKLEDAVRARCFREDLFHRLAVGTIYLPPLAERKSDIGALVEHILGNHREEIGDKQLTPAALGRLMTHDWPGNVRELSNVVLRAAAKTDLGWIRGRDVDAALGTRSSVVGPLSQASARALVMSCDGKVATAAKRCGVPRTTFRGWLTGRRRGGE
jgi:DNA-binding NtrC family response regulator